MTMRVLRAFSVIGAAFIVFRDPSPVRSIDKIKMIE
jgi:hypothetical protein